jgi:hypothetical protein
MKNLKIKEENKLDFFLVLPFWLLLLPLLFSFERILNKGILMSFSILCTSKKRWKNVHLRNILASCCSQLGLIVLHGIHVSNQVFVGRFIISSGFLEHIFQKCTLLIKFCRPNTLKFLVNFFVCLDS